MAKYHIWGKVGVSSIISLNEIEISNPSYSQFKTPVIRMLQELIGYFNSIKKDPGRNEVYMI